MGILVGSQTPKLSLSDFRPDPTKFVLILGSGVLTYEICSKVFRKIINQTPIPQNLIQGISLLCSVVIMIRLCSIQLVSLHTNFAALCIGYIVLSILNLREMKSTSSSSALPSYMIDMVAEAREGTFPMIGY